MKKYISAAAFLLLTFAFASCTDNISPEETDKELAGNEWLDPTFAQALQEKGYIENAVAVTPEDVSDIKVIDISGKSPEEPGPVKSLRGIEYFKSLTELDCSNNCLTSINISKNTQLADFSCDNNQLKALDVSNNTLLTALCCSNNQLRTLDVTGNTLLEWLNCIGNRLETLDISKNTKLTTLYCNGNRLTTIDVSANTQLSWLTCSENKLQTLDVGCNTLLEWLDCMDNSLETLDISKNTRLTVLSFSGNPGMEGIFNVTAWFGNTSVPDYFTLYSWKYLDKTVKANYQKAVTVEGK